MPDALVDAALAVRAHAHAPFSNFRVGAALEDNAGRIHTGCNVENATYGLTVCAERVAVFKAISDRVSLYPSFDYLTSELSRNLDAIIPRDPQSRLVWAQGIFIPLSRTLELELLAVGLDLRWPEAHQRTLTEKQKERLQRVFLTFAQEFRSGSSAR